MSQRWKDNTGREWIARITIELAEKMRGDGFDLLDPKQVGAVFTDPFKVLELLAKIHDSQITAAELTPAQFVELATDSPEVAEAAAAALESAMSDFFRRLRRPALAAVAERAQEAGRRTEAAAMEKANDPRLLRAMEAVAHRELAKLDAVIDRALTGATSGELPAS